MITLTPDTKACMSHLLLKDTFDSLSLIEGEITTYNKFTIDGHIHKDFYEEAPAREYSLWSELRSHCLSIIKGKRTPLGFKFILSLSREDIIGFLEQGGLRYRPEEIQGLYMNLRYDGTHLACVTGTSMHTFTMDKSLDEAWDRWVQTFYANAGIAFEAGR
ncbi:DUF5721 family protein [Extibacter muris]|uniref:DUF5721 family protein n=1 Tax=Extibacter muris TaxID=1796622 RepID=UPI001D0947B6|nr:DUF5721 family protein [Extibacter muris]MCB6201888.1 DUF5721 family protein [Extibacter muris]MCQ4663224.1 DUF5721 family protein [Extibacter muris]MCQ4692498.1 DUF5721 family protein [Extibacter muris]